MRLATFNVLHGRSEGDDRVDLKRFARAVWDLDADVLALQEVDRDQPRSENADLTALAAEAMGAAEHRFVPAISGTPGETWAAATGHEQPGSAAYGIALLSRYPVTAWDVIRLPPVPVRVPMLSGGRPVLARDEPRVAVLVTVQTPYGELRVVNTHLSFMRWSNGRQLHTLMRGVERVPRPMVLMGDLNMGPARAEALSEMRPLALHPTFPAHRPREQLDHVLLDGDLPGGVPVSEAVELPLSDHRALVVDVGDPR